MEIHHFEGSPFKRNTRIPPLSRPVFWQVAGERRPLGQPQYPQSSVNDSETPRELWRAVVEMTTVIPPKEMIPTCITEVGYTREPATLFWREQVGEWLPSWVQVPKLRT